MPTLRRLRLLIGTCSDLFGPEDPRANDKEIIGDPVVRKDQAQVTQLAVVPREPVLDHECGGKTEFEKAKDGVGENVHLRLGRLLGQRPPEQQTQQPVS